MVDEIWIVMSHELIEQIDEVVEDELVVTILDELDVLDNDIMDEVDIVEDEVEVDDIYVMDARLIVMDDEIDEMDFVIIYLENMCDMHLDEDEVVIEVITDDNLVDDEMVDAGVYEDVMLLHIEVVVVEHEAQTVILVLFIHEHDVNEYLYYLIVQIVDII